MKLILENVRSFVGRHEIPIRPLTFLVGGNNSGKSTALACLSVACQYPEFPFYPRWNMAPYSLGTFDTIATRRAGRPRLADQAFTVGVQGLRFALSEITAQYTEVSDKIVAKEVYVRWEEAILDAKVSLEGPSALSAAKVRVSGKGQPVRLDREFPHPVFGFDPLWSILESVKWALPNPVGSNQATEGSSIVDALINFGQMRQHLHPYALSLGPIRSHPKRLYEVEELADTGEGNNYPLILALHDEEDYKLPTRAGLFDVLADFGKEAGLFSHVRVRRTSSGGSRAIYITVQVAGKWYDLTDVGYGISQVLPILVRAYTDVSAAAILIQQPEAHLHPQAQAALGSFFALLASHTAPLVIETHSDYIVDRVRVEVAQGKLKPEDVQILYFDKPKAETSVYPIDLDECGNIVNPPPSYRQFFMREEMKLLTRAIKQ